MTAVLIFLALLTLLALLSLLAFLMCLGPRILTSLGPGVGFDFRLLLACVARARRSSKH